MKRMIPIVAALVVLFAASTPVFAQQDNKPAIVVMSSGIGVILPANDRVALRPEFSFSKSSTENSSTLAVLTNFDSWQVGAGASVLVYTGKPDAFRTYWSPRFAMSHQDSSSTGTNVYSASGSFGAQYRLGDRFTAFGELGLNYSWANTETTSTPALGITTTSTSKNHTFGTRSVVGVAFRF